MGKKRKQEDPGRDSSSSGANRCRSCHCQNGETSRLNYGIPPWEGFSDTIREAVIEFKNVMKLQFKTEEKFKRKIQKLKEKRKKDKKKHEENLRVLKEELESKIQEIQKQACAEVNHYKASPSHRSQLSQSTRFRLVIVNSVSKIIYKKEEVKTEDGGGYIKVVMYDGGNPIASDHRLASVRVELVVIEGGFDEKRNSWSKEEFEESIIKPRKTTTLTSLVKNGTFNLIGGSCAHEGATIMDNSQQREVKLGVRVTVPTETRVLEGVSNPFKVQEGKTKKSPNKKGNKPSPPVRTQKLVQLTNTQATQHGQGPVSPDFLFSKRVSPDEQHSLPPPVIPDELQKADRGKHTEYPTHDTSGNNRLSCPLVEGNGTAEDNRMSYPPATVPLRVEGNGQTLNDNSQQSSQQIPMAVSWQSTSAHSVQHEQGCSLPPPSMQNPLHLAGSYTVNHHLLASGQDQYNNFPNASSPLAFLNHHSLNNIPQCNSIPGGGIFFEGVNLSNVQPPVEEPYDTAFICNQVLLQWDEPHVELKKHCNFLDQLMPLYSTQSGFYRGSFPGTSVMDKSHKLLASISSGDSFLNMIMDLESQATQTPQRRGVLIRSIEPYGSHDGPPVKKQRNAKYQLRFVNRVCNDYYTREQIKSEDGNLLKVALYDENNLVVTSGPLSSASVEIVLLHGDFNVEDQDYWTSEEFIACLVRLQSVKEPPALGGDRVLALTDGEADLGNIYFQTSSFHARTGKYMMGVEIKNVREESVQEGITSPFLVRVRQGEESSHRRITSLEALLRVKIGLPKQVWGALECYARENVGASSLQQITATPSPAGPGDGGGNNNSNNNNNHGQEGLMATAEAGGGGGDGGGGGAGDGDGTGGGINKSMSMSERARVPQPEPGLNCPRCDSTNTKFCYFNNYRLTQPRHFCRACRRYWTRGGALRNVPVGGGYCRHAKRSAKPKAGSAAPGTAVAGTSSATSTTPSTTACTTGTTIAPPALQYSMFGSAPPHGSRFADSFDPASLGLSFPARLLFPDSGAYAADGGAQQHHHQGNGNGMEQWAAAHMQSFPFLHAMDHQMSGNPPPASAMHTTMAAMQGMFHLGLQSGGGGGNGDDGGNHQFHHPPVKRDHHHHHQQHQPDYPSSRGMYVDVVNGNGGGYNFYSSASNAAGN